MRGRAGVFVVCVAVALVVCAKRAEAQPGRGIFGSSYGAPAQTLSGGLSTGVGFFRTTGLSDEPEVVPDRTSESKVNVLGGTLNYDVTGRRSRLSASYRAGGRYFPDLEDTGVILGHVGTVSASYRPTTRTSLSAAQSVAYRPAFQTTFASILNPTGNLQLPDEIDSELLDRQTLTYVTTANLNQTLSSRSSLSAYYGHRRSEYDYVDQVQLTDHAGVRYTHELARGLSGRLGYRYDRSRVQDSGRPPSELHTFDAGLDYGFGRRIQLTDRTTFGFNTGSSIVTNSRRGTRARLTGQAVLNHQVGRTWSSSASVGRYVGFVEGLTEVVTTDRASVGIGGQLAGRVAVRASASASRGEVGFGEGSNHFIGYGANATMSVAVSRVVGLATGYTYRRSEFDREEELLPLRFREYHRAHAGVSIRPWTYVGFTIYYAYILSERDLSSGTPGFRRFNQRAVVASVNVSAPLYTRVTR